MNAATSAFLLAVHRAARRMAHAAFKPWLFHELVQLLRFDSGMWLRVGVTDAGPQMHDYYLDRQRPDRITAYLEQELWREDPFLQTSFGGGPVRAWVMSANDLPPGRLSDYLELHEQRHVVCSFEFEPVTRSFAGFSMFRRGHQDTFSEADRSLVEFIEPHLRDDWTHNWLREVGASRPPELPSDFAQSVCTADHLLNASDEHFAELILREWPHWHGPLLPDEWAMHLQLDALGPWVGRVVTAYFQTLPGGLILLRLRPIHALDLLPPRKRQVALLFAGGVSQSEVAAALALSPSTVNNYLVEVYRELGLRDKTELALCVARLTPPHPNANSLP